ncbi:MAG TPA: hypothetical protein DEP23_14295 [Ruminococcaceae bacterium]|nr:hypothetical protein [Oscillospiraceae bacterium]
MIPVSENYYPAAEATERTWRGWVSFELFDVTAKGDATATAESQSFAPASKSIDSINTAVPKYGTCEQDQFKADGSMSLFPETPSENFGWWSKKISNENGNFSNAPSITFSFTSLHSSIGFTLTFAEPVFEIRVYAYRDGTLLNTQNFSGLSGTTITLDFPIENYNKLVFEIKKVSPYHYAKLLEVGFGIEYTYSDDLVSFDVLEEIDLTGRTVSSNSMTVTLNNIDQRFNMFNPQNEIRFLQERQELTEGTDLLVGGSWESVPLGKHYLSKWESPSQNTTKLTAYDILSLMTGTYYQSKMYSAERAEVILTELFKAAGCYDDVGNPLFYIHTNIRDVTLTGYIAPMSYKDALQRIAFALGAVVKVDRYGKILVYRATEETRNAIVMDKSTIYKSHLIMGTFAAGQGTILARDTEPVPNPAVIDRSLYQSPKTTLGNYYNQVNILKYDWAEKETTDKLYEGTVTGDTVITFSSYPATDVSISGTYESAEIYACACALHGASGTITITGKVYQASSKTVSAVLPDVAESVTPNSLDIKDITLIGQDDTAAYVAEWLLEKLQSRTTQSFSWWINPAVEASDFVKVENEFGSYGEAQIKKMQFTYDGGLSGSSEVIE